MQNNCEDYQSAHVILPGESSSGCLVLGDFNSAVDPSVLCCNNIKTIITAAEGLAHLQISPSINHITYPLLDSKTENISAFFEKSHQTIEHSLMRGGVLVHCAAGISRSATLVIAFLMKKNRWGFRKTIDFVRKKRPCVCPNLGFEMQLKAYQKELALGLTPMSRNSRMAHRSRNIITADFESGISQSNNPQRGASFPTIPHHAQTRSLLKRKAVPRNILLSREKEQAPPSRHSSILKDNLIISSLTAYQNPFHQQQPKLKRNEQQPYQIARNLAKMMFGSHMHKWSSSKVIEQHVHSLTRAKRLAHLKKN